MTVLIADESSVLRKTLKSLLLRIDGIERILETHSVFSTINQIEIEMPDLIILDLQLGEGRGTDVLSYLGLKDPRPLVVVLTNYADSNNKRTCMDRGADFFFDKSNEYKDLLSILKYYVDTVDHKNQEN